MHWYFFQEMPIWFLLVVYDVAVVYVLETLYTIET